MKKLLLIVFTIFFVVPLFSQFCNTATTTEAIVPTTSVQNTTTYSSGRIAFTFNAIAGNEYTFSTCGTTTQDTYLRLYSTATGGSILSSSDDFCSTQSEITWTCNTSGTYSVFLTRYSCNPLNTSTYMAYSMVEGTACTDNEITINMIDSYGDGWNGATYTLKDDGGTTVSTGTLFSGTSDFVVECVVDGCYTMTVTGGTYPSEVSWNITLGGTTLASGGANVTDQQVPINSACIPPSAPDNDDPSGAIELTVNDAGGYRTYSNAFSTGTATEVAPSCASYTGEDIWFKVVVPTGINVLDIDTQTGDITDGGMTIYRGTPGSLTEIECDDDDALDGLMPWIYREDFIPGETIYIRVWEYGGGTTGTFNIFVSTPQALPVELTQFEATEYPHWNVVKWTTASEQNSDYFSLERSEDGLNWREIATKEAAGNSNEDIRYSYIDYSLSPLVYYRLKQVDIDGKVEIYGPIVIHRNQEFKRVVKYINLAGQEVNPSTTKGVIIEIYDDGTMRKMIK